MFISAWTRKKLSLQFSYYYGSVTVNKRGGQHMGRFTICFCLLYKILNRASYLFLRATILNGNYTQNRHRGIAINQSPNVV